MSIDDIATLYTMKENNCNNLEDELFEGILTLLDETFLNVEDLADTLHRPFDVGTSPFLDNSTPLPLLSPRSVEMEVAELESFFRQLAAEGDFTEAETEAAEALLQLSNRCPSSDSLDMTHRLQLNDHYLNDTNWEKKAEYSREPTFPFTTQPKEPPNEEENDFLGLHTVDWGGLLEGHFPKMMAIDGCHLETASHGFLAAVPVSNGCHLHSPPELVSGRSRGILASPKVEPPSLGRLRDRSRLVPPRKLADEEPLGNPEKPSTTRRRSSGKDRQPELTKPIVKTKKPRAQTAKGKQARATETKRSPTRHSERQQAKKPSQSKSRGK